MVDGNFVDYRINKWSQCPLQKEKGKAKTEQQTDSVQKKKSVYDKLFKDKKKHTVNKGTITVHQYEDKIYLELPVELMGRDF